MFTGTTIEDLFMMVERVEDDAATQIRLEQEIRKVPVMPMEYEYYRPERFSTMVGVA